MKPTAPLRTVLISLAIVMCLGASCQQRHSPAVFDLDSVNVGSLPSDWPPMERVENEQGEKVDRPALTPAQREVLEERGRPYCVRARWDARGGFTWGDELRHRYRRHSVDDIMATAHYGGEAMPFDISWIYPAEDYNPRRPGNAEYFQGEEVIFIDDSHYEVEPVGPKLGIVIDHGDPEHRRDPESWRGHIRESWIYYADGRIFHFVDDQLVNIEVIPTMGSRVLPEI